MEIENNTAIIDARPALPVSEDSLWDYADKKRDNVAAIIDAEFKKQNISAWIRKSHPGEYPLYVVVDSWIQKGETTHSVFLDKSSLQVIISVDPCREHPYTYKVDLNRQGRAFSREDWVLNNFELRELTAYLIQGGEKPKFFQFRFFPPVNKLIPEARQNHWTMLNILG